MLLELSHKQQLKLLPRNINKMDAKQYQALGARLLFHRLKYLKDSKAFAIICIRMQTYF